MFTDENLEASEVTPLTMAILPKFDEYGNLHAEMITETGDYLVQLTPLKVIQLACSFFASSFEGRLEGTKRISSFTHKAPIAIDPASGIYFFPTKSPRNKECAWLSHSHIKSINYVDRKKTEVVFQNGRRIYVDVSKGSLNNQLQRTAQFRYVLDKRMQTIRGMMSQQEVSEVRNTPYRTPN